MKDEGHRAWMLEKDKSIELPKTFLTNSIPFAFAHTLSNHAREIAVSRSVLLVTFQPGHPDHRSMTHLVSTLFPRAHARVCMFAHTHADCAACAGWHRRWFVLYQWDSPGLRAQRTRDRALYAIGGAPSCATARSSWPSTRRLDHL